MPKAQRQAISRSVSDGRALVRVRVWTKDWVALGCGGLLTGVAFIRWGQNATQALTEWNPLQRKMRREKMLTAATVQPVVSALRRKPRIVDAQELPPAEFISQEVDPILDKISAHGIQSLTERERQILQAARAKMSKR